MLIPMRGEPVESYKDYKHKVFERHKKKAKDIVMQIRQCSLKQEDKDKLIKELIQILNP